MLKSAPLWLAALWWGSLTTLGFLVVPLLFIHLPTPALAGAMAARLFSAQTWVTLGCGLLLLLLWRKHQDEERSAYDTTAMLCVLGGLLLALLTEFAVAPRIVARENVAVWHRVGTVLYALQWLCAGIILHRCSRQGRPA